MSQGGRRPADRTAEAAVGDLASDSLFAEVLSRIADETDRCRMRFYRAGRHGWKNEYMDRAEALSAPRAQVTRVVAPDDSLRKLVKPIDEAKEPRTRYRKPKNLWWQDDTRLRDRALVLLRFACPVPVTSSELAALDVEDLARTAKGLEVRLYRRDARPTRYVTIPFGSDPGICPAAAALAWKRRLSDAGHRSGPFFVRMDSTGRLAAETTRMTSAAVDRILTAVAPSTPPRPLPRLPASQTRSPNF